MSLSLGKWGEQIAVDMLIKEGYEILERNWRYQKAEIDIIAKKEHWLVIVEVKTRAEGFIVSPEDAVDQKKIKRIVTAADAYVVQRELDVEIRFDIVSIVKMAFDHKINHKKEAFLFF